MMDEISTIYAEAQMQMLKTAAADGGYGVQAVDTQQTPIPTFLVEAVSLYQEEDWSIACNVVPMHHGTDAFVCVQLYLAFSNAIADDKMETIERFVKAQNERMMVGNLLIFGEHVCIKYAMSYGYGETMDADMFRHAIHMVAMQADIMAKKCNDLMENKIDLDTLLQKHPFSV